MPLIILKTCIKSASLRLYSSVGKFNSCSLSYMTNVSELKVFLKLFYARFQSYVYVS